MVRSRSLGLMKFSFLVYKLYSNIETVVMEQNISFHRNIRFELSTKVVFDRKSVCLSIFLQLKRGMICDKFVM